MVNVTKSNFIEQSNDLLEHLPSAAFIAIDEEMTGIQLPGSKRPSKNDTPSKRYESLKQVPERYSIIQVGVALFHEDPSYSPEDENSNEFIVRKYNFYLFPPESNWHTREVTLNPSSVAFLNQNNMNFDLWTKEGVSYVTNKVAADLMKKHRDFLIKQSAQNKNTSGDGQRNNFKRKVELTRTEDVSFHARAMCSLREWIDSAAAVAHQAGDHERSESDTEGMSFLLPRCNAFLRRALYESIEIEYPALVLERAGKDNPNQIRVWRLSPEEKIQREARKRREEWENLIVNEIGFWRVFRAISNACRGISEKGSIALARSASMVDETAESTITPTHLQIPLVVHNGLMDLLFLLTHFHDHRLPDSYEEAKALIHEYFPVIYDTKVLATEYSNERVRNSNSVLANLYNSVVVHDEEGSFPKMKSFVPYTNGLETQMLGQQHEAEFDAFMTGAVFASLSKRILSRQENATTGFGSIEGQSRTGGVGSLWHLLKPIQDKSIQKVFGRNKLHLMLTLYTMDLESPLSDPPQRGIKFENTYCVSGADPSITVRDIVSALPFLGTTVNFDVIWVNDTSFMVAVRYTHDEDEADDVASHHGIVVMRALKRKYNNGETIRTLKEQQDLEAQRQLALSADNVWWPLRLAWSTWNRVMGDKRKLEDGEDEERSNKRRRVA